MQAENCCEQEKTRRDYFTLASCFATPCHLNAFHTQQDYEREFELFRRTMTKIVALPVIELVVLSTTNQLLLEYVAHNKPYFAVI